MSTNHVDLFRALALPFDKDEVKVRSHSGRQLYYITARTVMNRLDNVLGPMNWWDDFTEHENSVVCRLTIRLPDGTELTKSDAGGFAGMKDEGDDSKSGYSDAFKRASVKFGVARYLYRDGVPAFVWQGSTEASGGDVIPGPGEPDPAEASQVDPSEPETAHSQDDTQPEPTGPAEDKPAKMTFWSYLSTEVERINSAWAADYPDAPVVVAWGDVIRYLANTAHSLKYIEEKPSNKAIKPEQWIGILTTLGESDRKYAKFLKTETDSFLNKRIASERAKIEKPGKRGPR